MKTRKSICAIFLTLMLCINLLVVPTVTVSAAGENLYQNGGFEEYTSGYTFPYNPYYHCASGGAMPTYLERESASANESLLPAAYAEPYNGSNYVCIYNNKYWNAFYNDTPTLDTEKTYLYSKAVCVPPGSSSYTGGTRISEASDISYYVDNVKQNGFTFTVDEDWKKVSAVFTPTSATGYSIKYWLEPSWSKTLPSTFIDDIFLGELVMEEVEILADGAALPKSLITREETTFNLSAKVYNQLGTVEGLDTGRVETSFSLVDGPDGVTLEAGVLSIPQGTTGTVNLTAEAAPTESWKGAPEETIEKTISIALYDKEHSLSSITVDGKPEELLLGTSTFTVDVPVLYENDVDTLKMPAVAASAKDPAHTVTVSEFTIDRPTVAEHQATSGLKTTATATITVSDGNEVIDSYTVILRFIGENLYENGSFEKMTGTPGYDPDPYNVSFMSQANKELVPTATEEVYSGERSIFTGKLAGASNYGITYKNSPLLAENKTYLYSNQFRLADGASSWTTYIYSLDAATAAYYADSVKLSGSGVAATNTWKNYQVVFTRDTEGTSPIWFMPNSWANMPNTYLDDFYLGELVMADAALFADGNALPSFVVTKTAKTLTPMVLNQLGTTAGLEDKADVTLALVGDAPAGISVSNNELVVAAGTTGTVTVKVTATPKATWANPAQTSFEKVITLNLTADSKFVLTGENGVVTSELCFENTAAEARDTILYYATYTNGGEELKSIKSETATIAAGELYVKVKKIPVAQGETVKCFLWESGTLKPLVLSGTR